MYKESKKKVTMTALLAGGVGMCFAQNAVQPWSGHKVHDTNRPAPEKVTNNGAVILKAPKDADVIFSGENTDALRKKWPVKDGVMSSSRQGDNFTKKSYGDCQVHIEWRVPKSNKVRGQHGANSGIFLMGLYEIQIQESFVNKTYPDGQAGAIYGQYPPLKNASVAQGEWHSYDIFFKAPVYDEKGMVKPAVMTVLHNGVIIHNARVLHGPTVWKKVATYPKTHPKKGPIHLQWHGDRIDFRNFWVRDL